MRLHQCRVRVAAPPRAAEGLGRLPVRVAVAGAAEAQLQPRLIRRTRRPITGHPAAITLSSLPVVDAPRS